MSELQMYNSERIYWAVEQVEQEAGDIDDLHLDDNLFYLKSGTDKVIAELEKKIDELQDKVTDLLLRDRNMALNFNNAVDALVHNKYKRCLAMAMWCEATALWCYQAANTLPIGFRATLYGKPVMIEPNRLFKRFALLTKWSARWFKLAKKFKEAQ